MSAPSPSIPVAPAPVGAVPPMPKAPAPAATPEPSIADKIAKTFEKPAPLPPEQVRPPSAQQQPTPPKPGAQEAPKPAEPVIAPKSLLPKKSAKTETPPAPGAEPDDEFAKFKLPETASDEQRGQFTELKRISREQRAQLKELQTKINAPTTPTAEVERLRAEHKAATDRLAMLDLQSHPDFQRQFVQPKTKALAEAQEILAYSGKEGVDVNALLGKDRKNFSAAVAELTKDLNQMDATTVQTALRDAYRITGEEKLALSKSTELRQQIQQQTEAQARQAFAEVSENLGPIGEFLVTIDVPEGATAEEKQEIATYNQAVTNLRPTVEKTVFGPTNEKHTALMGWKAGTLDFLVQHAIPRMEKTYATLLQEHAALAKELAALKGTKGSGPVSGDPSKSGSGARKSNEQLIAETFHGGR